MIEQQNINKEFLNQLVEAFKQAKKEKYKKTFDRMMIKKEALINKVCDKMSEELDSLLIEAAKNGKLDYVVKVNNYIKTIKYDDEDLTDEDVIKCIGIIEKDAGFRIVETVRMKCENNCLEFNDVKYDYHDDGRHTIIISWK